MNELGEMTDKCQSSRTHVLRRGLMTWVSYWVRIVRKHHGQEQKNTWNCIVGTPGTEWMTWRLGVNQYANLE